MHEQVVRGNKKHVSSEKALVNACCVWREIT